jgi:hypothetical protein
MKHPIVKATPEIVGSEILTNSTLCDDAVDTAISARAINEYFENLLQQAFRDFGIDPDAPDAKSRALRLLKDPSRSAKLRAFTDTL